MYKLSFSYQLREFLGLGIIFFGAFFLLTIILLIFLHNLFSGEYSSLLFIILYFLLFIPIYFYRKYIYYLLIKPHILINDKYMSFPNTITKSPMMLKITNNDILKIYFYNKDKSILFDDIDLENIDGINVTFSFNFINKDNIVNFMDKDFQSQTQFVDFLKTIKNHYYEKFYG